MNTLRPTVLVLGDQLNRGVGALADRGPDDCRVLLVESEAVLRRHRWHRQRAHLVLSAMRHFAADLRAEGFEVDLRPASSIAAGLDEHVRAHDVDEVIAMEPGSHQAVAMLTRLGVSLVPDDLFLTDRREFATWASTRSRTVMEDFYRWQRIRLDILMDGAGPEGGSWNFDHLNRDPPPTDGRDWPGSEPFTLDAIDRAVHERLENDPELDLWGAPAAGLWPVSRTQARQRLEEFVEQALPIFGTHEDAMLLGEWKLAHSTLSSSLNLGLLTPHEVVAAAEDAYRRGRVPINSAEGFIRQIIGWREYVRGLYWAWGPEYGRSNHLDADRPVPPAFTGEMATDMRCVATTVEHIHDHAYAHHIERLMVLGNLALTSGVDPQAMTRWMWANFIDGAEWVMVPNVVGMALFADGGRMATKPYASGGAYINRMSDACGSCRYNPTVRVGEDACPFTSLYWDFLARNEPALSSNHRLGRQLAGMRRLRNLDATRERAAAVLVGLERGKI